MDHQRGGTVLVVVIVLAVLFFFLIFKGCGGWGYPGYYRGHSYRPSFWHWGGPRYHKSSQPSVRSGSTSGPSHRGGGPRSGK